MPKCVRCPNNHGRSYSLAVMEHVENPEILGLANALRWKGELCGNCLKALEAILHDFMPSGWVKLPTQFERDMTAK